MCVLGYTIRFRRKQKGKTTEDSVSGHGEIYCEMWNDMIENNPIRYWEVLSKIIIGGVGSNLPAVLYRSGFYNRV